MIPSPIDVRLSKAAVHRPTMAGISGTAAQGADSIGLNGGYEDDEGDGAVVIYTGHGGNDPQHEVADRRPGVCAGQRRTGGQCRPRAPRACRSRSEGDPAYSPSSGYRYDGVYRVDDWWSETGISGYRIFRFRLVKDAGCGPANPAPGRAPEGDDESRYVTTQRVVRNTAVTQWVKELHEFTCQVCGIRLATPSGSYAEGAHIRPPGKPHSGPDVPGNVLCLCPNDHVLLDRGFLTITDDFEVVESGSDRVVGRLRLRPQHTVDLNCLEYHRAHFAQE